MRINAVGTPFGMKWQTKGTKVLRKTTINLDNGKTLKIREQSIDGRKYYKLMSLFNQAGEWVKSKLTYYSAGKAAKTINTQT